MADIDADKKRSEAGADLSSRLKDILPEEFDLSLIGAIDLKEAEAIADEDLVILNEEDLIEGLDEFDLIPLAGTPASDRQKDIFSPSDRKVDAVQVNKPSTAAGRELKITPARSQDKKRTTESFLIDNTPPVQIEKKDGADRKDALSASLSFSKEDYYPEYDEYIIPDIAPTAADNLSITQEKASEEVAADEDMPGRPALQPLELPPSTPEKSKEPAREVALTPYETPVALVASVIEAPAQEEVFSSREVLSASLSTIPAESRVFFIDDEGPVEPASARIFEEIDLDKIISGTAQVAEGTSYILSEADAHEDRSRVVLVTDDTHPIRQDEMLDFSFRYLDEDLDYIHTAIVEEDYGDYMMRIDEFLKTGFKPIPESVELLGLTADEYDMIEDALFRDELQRIGQFQRYGLYQFDRAAREAAGKAVKYLIPVEESLLDAERHSIESDISSVSALVFEEDVERIREHLREMSGIDIVIDEEQVSVSAGAGAEDVMAPDLTGTVETISHPADEDILRDITDRVVILNDEEDVERFVQELTERKRADMRTLLKYLDGLFETLPEDIIRKFASSEYFDLYLKVLNEMGV